MWGGGGGKGEDEKERVEGEERVEEVMVAPPYRQTSISPDQRSCTQIDGICEKIHSNTKIHL